MKKILFVILLVNWTPSLLRAGVLDRIITTDAPLGEVLWESTVPDTQDVLRGLGSGAGGRFANQAAEDLIGQPVMELTSPYAQSANLWVTDTELEENGVKPQTGLYGINPYLNQETDLLKEQYSYESPYR